MINLSVDANRTDTIHRLLQKAENQFKAGDISGVEESFQQLRFCGCHEEKYFTLFGKFFITTNNLVEAKNFLIRGVELYQQSVTIHHLYGIVCNALEEYSEAEKHLSVCYSVIGEDSSIILNYSVALCGSGKYAEGIKVLENGLKLFPDDREMRHNLALAYYNSGKLSDAFVQYEVLTHHPESLLTGYNGMARILIEQHRYSEAETILLKLLEAGLTSAHTIEYLLHVYNQQERFTETIKIFHNLTESEISEDVLFKAGEAFYNLFSFTEALTVFQEVLKTQPENVEALYNAGATYLEMGMPSDALQMLNKAYSLAPNDAKIPFALAETFFYLGEYSKAWKYYEFRRHLLSEPFSSIKIQRWKGENISGKRVLVAEEQGAGDTFMFLPYVKLLKREGAIVHFASGKLTKRLVEHLGIVDKVIPIDNVETGNYDYYIPLLSLPLMLGILTPGGITDTFCIKIAEQNEFTFPKDEKLRVGLVWKGNTVSVINRKRHCPPDLLKELFDLHNVTFYSLQIGEKTEIIEELKNCTNFIDLSEYLTDYYDTAKVIEDLDLIITVDTSVAHLAGRLSKPVWIMLSYVPDWRWGMKGNTTEWYPTAKLFRQHALSDWKGVVAEIKSELKNLSNQNMEKSVALGIALTKGENFGWGVCSNYLRKELADKYPFTDLQDYTENSFDGVVLHAITGVELEPLHKIRGKVNVGYTFFENVLTEKSRENAGQYDLILAGSTWCKEKLEEKKIYHSDVLIQGIDPQLFYPAEMRKPDNLFVIFSGGKFELRKGQDLVLRAVKILQDKYKDVILLNAWYNMWPATMLTMTNSRYINFELKGTDWSQVMNHLYEINGMDLSRIITLPLTNNSKLREIYARTDVGLFPNRCEGGTNLVLMEYMACGRPVIASYNSGHKDVLTNSNAYLLQDMHTLEVYEKDGSLSAIWDEPVLDEIVALLEHAYHNRSECVNKGNVAGEFMKKFTWSKTADDFLRAIRKFL